MTTVIDDKTKGTAHAEDLSKNAQVTQDFDSTIHHPEDWWSWRLVGTSKSQHLELNLDGD